MMLVSSLVVMLALITESNRLYARLALATAACDRERDARLMTMDALTAAIAHEVGQPLTGAIANSLAGLEWVTRQQPDVEKASKALRTAIDDGNRTAEVIDSIRATFTRGPLAATEFSLNELVRETAAFLDRELAGEKVSLELTLDEELPPILADRVQIQRVLVNLFTNAIEFPARHEGPDAPDHDPLDAAGWRACAARGQRHRNRHRARGKAANLRRLLHDQGDGHRPRPVALPDHRRGAWRTPLGLGRQPAWRDLPPRAASQRFGGLVTQG